MSNSLLVSAYAFSMAFALLSALVVAVRGLKRLGTRSNPKRRRNVTNIARKHLALLRSRGATSGPRQAPEEVLAPPPIPQNQFTYMQAADYLHNPRSPYPISPPQPRQRDEC